MLRLAVAAVIVASMTGPAVAPAGSCTLEEVVMTWGFKESFRSYISGAIAQGEWTVEGEVGYDTPTFSFTGQNGYLMPDRSAGEAEFNGALRFIGHGGILDTSLGNPRLVFESDSTATLYLDVVGDTMEEVSVAQPQVPFAALSWDDSTLDSDSGTWSVTQANVTLTEAGSDAFGTYPAGEALDPLDFRITTTPGCLLPETAPWGIVGGVAGLAVLGGVAALTIVRVRKSRGQGRQ